MEEGRDRESDDGQDAFAVGVEKGEAQEIAGNARPDSMKNGDRSKSQEIEKEVFRLGLSEREIAIQLIIKTFVDSESEAADHPVVSQGTREMDLWSLGENVDHEQFAKLFRNSDPEQKGGGPCRRELGV